jgi:hypothetical protein
MPSDHSPNAITFVAPLARITPARGMFRRWMSGSMPATPRDHGCAPRELLSEHRPQPPDRARRNDLIVHARCSSVRPRWPPKAIRIGGCLHGRLVVAWFRRSDVPNAVSGVVDRSTAQTHLTLPAVAVGRRP